jgi:FMNH2-dependent dimethyl sulfone monooxygenase
MARNADVLRGPFDPGGQPETRSGNALELGFFAWNLSGGMTASKAVLADVDRYRDFWHWDTALHLNQEAERIGYEYQVPFGRWKGHGGASGYNDYSLDFLAAAACLAPVTRTMGLFSTAHITYKFHPLHIAKIGATIDNISKGRWGLNVVTGASNNRENLMFGQEPLDHDLAYDMADEFVTLMKWLWLGEPINFEGDYYKAYDATVLPGPTRRPRPILMNAGNSPVGVDFAAKHCDWAFGTARTLDEYEAMVKRLHETAAKYNRTVRPATMVYIIIAETDQRAADIVKWVEDEVDKEAANSFLFNRTRDPKGSLLTRHGSNMTEEDEWGGLGKETYMRFALGLSAWHIYGGVQSVAEQMKQLHDLGLESLLTCFFDPIRGLHLMEDDVIPLLRKMGLRK